MIIHPIEDTINTSSYSDQQEECPEVVLLQRLVWVQYQSHWWPALLFQDYFELQDFMEDEMDTVMKAHIAVAIMRQVEQRRNTTKVARLLGKPTIEVVEIATKYHEFYNKLPQFLPKAISKSRFGGETDLFLHMHRALDQVEVIISEICQQPFSLLPGMGSTTWLQKALAQVDKSDDTGSSTNNSELRDRTKTEISTYPVTQKRPMAHLMQSTQRSVPFRTQRTHKINEANRGASNDSVIQQYKALAKIAHNSDEKSIGSMLSTCVVPPERTASGIAVRGIEIRGSESTQLQSNRKKHSANNKGIRKSMPSIKEAGKEERDEMVSRNHKKLSDSREAPAMNLRKISREDKAPLPRQTKAEIRRPPMILAMQTDRVAIPTVSHDGHMRRVQEYLLHQHMSVSNDKEFDRIGVSTASYDGSSQRAQEYILHDQASECQQRPPMTIAVETDRDDLPSAPHGRVPQSIPRQPATIQKEYRRDLAPTLCRDSKTSQVQDYLRNQQRSAANVQEECESPIDADVHPTLPIATPVRQQTTAAASSDRLRKNDDSIAIQLSQSWERDLQHPPRSCSSNKILRRPPRSSSQTPERDVPPGDSFSNGTPNEDSSIIGDDRSVPESSGNNFDDYLTQTEKTLELLIKREKESLSKRHTETGRDYQRSRRDRGAEPRGYRERRGRSRKHRRRRPKEYDPSAFLDGCFLADAEHYEPSIASTSFEDDEFLPDFSDTIIKMANKGFLACQDQRSRPARSRRKKKGAIEILPGLEGDDIAPGLSEKINKMIAKKGFFSRHDVLKMIEDLNHQNKDETDDESISINRFDELARQRIQKIMR
ncbi:MAG: hypothetical protein SGBAC_007626 [Bacillariaceae sp.]